MTQMHIIATIEEMVFFVMDREETTWTIMGSGDLFNDLS